MHCKFLAPIALLALTGCAASRLIPPSAQPGLVLQGMVHGGQQPIAGAQVYLFAVSTSGYGSAASSLLTSATGQTADTSGNFYTLTDRNGAFSITGDYACTQGQQVYLYALGGDPGSGPNASSGLIASVGSCPAAGSFLASVPFINVNELTTVAFAYAVSGFAVDPLHVAVSGTPLAATGLANAFANTANLLNGATTPTGNGSVPLAELNTLANILASCINSNGAVTAGDGITTTDSTCYTLFQNAGSGGTQPTDTAAAAINIAHNPTANVATLFNLQAPGAPFAPTLTTAPNDFTVALTFTGPAISTNNVGSAFLAHNIAVDAAGNIWKPNLNENTVAVLSPLGVPSSFATGPGPANVAIDHNGNAWIPNTLDGSVSALTPAGSPLFGGPLQLDATSPNDIAIDGFGNVWLPSSDGLYQVDSAGNLNGASPFPDNFGATNLAIRPSGVVWTVNQNATVSTYSNAGSPMNPTTPYALQGSSTISGIAFDAGGSAWIAQGPSLNKLTSSGTPAAGSPFLLNGAAQPVGLAVDGAGSIWLADAGTNAIVEVSNTGAILSGAHNLQPGVTTPESISIDGSGNVWFSTVNSNPAIYELIGAATPAVTPLAYATQQNLLGSRP